jgi:hypothetical protein
MSPVTISCIVFACILGGILVGMILRAVLPEHHLSSESKDVVKLGMGLIGTMTALVLGLLIASAKSSFDTQRTGLAQMSANLIMLDRALAHYGPEAKPVRETLHADVVDMIERTWPKQAAAPANKTSSRSEGRYEGLYEQIQALAPKSDVQRAMKDEALKIAVDTAQARWLLFSEKGGSIPTPFMVVMVAWLVLILATFALFADPNATVVVVLLICAVAVSSAIFLILELDEPFGGIIQISSAPLQNALALIGR